MRRGWGAALIFLWSAAAAGPPEPRTPIEVKVEVTEVDQARASSLGVDWSDGFQVVEKSPAGILAIGSMERTTALMANVHWLVEEGAAELLANPNLITDSGTVATFNAGGEIPYITSTSLGSTHVEFKSYGVLLSIQPRLLADGLIQMKVRAAVSAPDETNGVSLSGNSVPALSERQVTSRVTVRPDTTITLAGLVQTRQEEMVRGVPVLRRIPLLGALFRWKKKVYRRTSVVVFVTPRLVEF